MGGVSFVTDTIGGLVGGVVDTVSDLGSEIDDFVNEEIPGGWGTVAVGAGAAYGAGLFDTSAVTPDMLATANATADPIATLNAQAGWTTSDLGYLAQIGAPGPIIEQAAANNAVLSGTSPDYYNANYSATAADTGSFLTPDQLAQYGAGAGTIAALGGGAAEAAGASGSSGAATGAAALTPAMKTAIGQILGGLITGGAVSGLGGGVGNANVVLPTPSNRAGVSTGSADYSPEYYQQLQQYYNAYMPTQPKDVATPLQQWYETKFTPDANVTNKLFGV